MFLANGERHMRDITEERPIAAASAAKDAAERTSKEIAIDAQASHQSLLADNAGLREYIASHRLQPGSTSGTAASTGTAGDLAAGLPQAATAGAFVATTEADLQACDADYAYAVCAYDFGQQLIARSLAKSADPALQVGGIEWGTAVLRTSCRRRICATPAANQGGGIIRRVRVEDFDWQKAAAGAENNARSTTRKGALALESNAINIGNGLPSQASSSLGLGVSAGSSAVGTTATSNNAYNSSVGILQSGYGTAMSGHASRAQTLSSLYGQQLQACQLTWARVNASRRS